MNLYGWKAIIDAMGLPGRVVRYLIEHEGLPVVRTGKTIFTSQEMLDLWMTAWLKRNARNQITQSIIRKMNVGKDPQLEAIELLALAAEAKKRGLWSDPPEEYREAGKKRAESYRKIMNDVRRFPD